MACVDEVETASVRSGIHEEAFDSGVFLERIDTVLLLERRMSNLVLVESSAEDLEELAELGEDNRLGAWVFNT